MVAGMAPRLSYYAGYDFHAVERSRWNGFIDDRYVSMAASFMKSRGLLIDFKHLIKIHKKDSLE